MEEVRGSAERAVLDGVCESQGEALGQVGRGTPKLEREEVEVAEDTHLPFFESGPESSPVAIAPNLSFPCRRPHSASWAVRRSRR